MPRDDEKDRVFDVSKPNKASPGATSKPIIVGHHPIMSDPMVKEDNVDRPQLPRSGHKTIKIQSEHNEPDESAEHEKPAEPAVPAPEKPGPAAEDVSPTLAPAIAAQPLHPESVEAVATPSADAVKPTTQSPTGELHLTSLDDLIGHEHHMHDHGLGGHHESADASLAPQVHKPARKGSKKSLWLLIALLLVVVAGYLAIDSRLIKTSIKLPFHVFKQPAPVSQSAGNLPTSASIVSSDPYAGWKTYDDGVLSFKYPNTWQVDSQQSKNGTADISAPDDGGISLVNSLTGNTATAFQDVHLVASISFLAKSANFAQAQQCMGEGTPANTCTVYSASPITIAGVSKPQLVISDFDDLGYPTYLSVSDDPAAQLGAKTFKTGVSVGDKIEFMEANVVYKSKNGPGFVSYAEIESASNFKNSQTYKDLVKVFESVSYKSSNP